VAERGEVRELIPRSYSLVVSPIEWKDKRKREKKRQREKRAERKKEKKEEKQKRRKKSK
jgi:hypothetical protein